MNMEFVRIGEIVNTFGIKGELKIRSFSDFEDERYAIGSTVYVGEEHIPFVVNSYKHHKGFTIVQFKDNEDINLIEKYKTMNIYKDRSDIKPLEKGRYYFSDLVGLSIKQNDKVIGECIDVVEGTKYNYIRVKISEKVSLVPFIEQFIKKVDLDKRIIEIIDLEGLV